MFKKVNWKYSLIAAAIASFMFCVCAFIYIYRAVYSLSWVLYIGSSLFFFVMAASTVIESRKRGGDESTVALVFVSHVSTILGIMMSVVICFILLLLLDPGFISSGHAERVMEGNPPSSIQGKTNGLVFRIFFAAIVLCFFGGSIAGVTIPFYSKRNQTKDNKEPTPFKQKRTPGERSMSGG